MSWIQLASGAGLPAGYGLVLRGLTAFRSDLLVADTATSTISSVAAGEVRISGVIEPSELTSVSLRQSAPSACYRTSIGRGGYASIPDSDDIDQIYRYNTGLAQVPGVLLAAVLGWRERKFFAAEAGDAARSDKTPGTTT